MCAPHKKRTLHDFCNRIQINRLKRLQDRLFWRKVELDLKSEMQSNSHSLLWVWEFSKKAVLICFIFYVTVQIYSMVVMVIHCDFTYLGELINQTGEIVQNCVFAYLVKAGFENVGKIFCNSKTKDSDDEPVG